MRCLSLPSISLSHIGLVLLFLGHVAVVWVWRVGTCVGLRDKIWYVGVEGALVIVPLEFDTKK